MTAQVNLARVERLGYMAWATASRRKQIVIRKIYRELKIEYPALREQIIEAFHRGDQRGYEEIDNIIRVAARKTIAEWRQE